MFIQITFTFWQEKNLQKKWFFQKINFFSNILPWQLTERFWKIRVNFTIFVKKFKFFSSIHSNWDVVSGRQELKPKLPPKKLLDF